jgi:hypothetical protein
MLHYIRDTRSVKSPSGQEVWVDTCRRTCTRGGSVWTTFAVIPSSAGSIMRSRRPSRHGEQTVSYFLLQDCKSITYNGRTRGVKERERGENKGERETQKEHLCRKLLELGTEKDDRSYHHFCGDPVFGWVYHEITQTFTPWRTVRLLLITGL